LVPHVSINHGTFKELANATPARTITVNTTNFFIYVHLLSKLDTASTKVTVSLETACRLKLFPTGRWPVPFL
jgi:hypothetical protein